MTTQMIELANIKSQAYQGLNTRSKDNAQWENVVNLDLHEGDQISVANAIINIRGISSDSTVEILGEDNESGISDSKVGMRFTPYVNDNGTNSVALPFCVASRHMKLPLHGDVDDYPTLQTLAMPNEGISMQMLTTARSNDANGNAPYNAGEPKTDDNTFLFTYTNNGDTGNPYSPYGIDTNTYFTEKAANGEWNSVSGHKYTVMDPNYMGPFRSDADGNFHSGEDDCKPMYLDIKVNVNGPLYESPSTLADNINQQRNSTNVYSNNAIDPNIQNGSAQTVELPALTGPLLKVKKVNGTSKDKGDCRGQPQAVGKHSSEGHAQVARDPRTDESRPCKTWHSTTTSISPTQPNCSNFTSRASSCPTAPSTTRSITRAPPRAWSTNTAGWAPPLRTRRRSTSTTPHCHSTFYSQPT